MTASPIPLPPPATASSSSSSSSSASSSPSSSTEREHQHHLVDLMSPIKKQGHLPSSSSNYSVSHSSASFDAATTAAAQSQNRTRITVLAMVIVTELIVQVLSAAMVPFFPDFAEKHLGANSTIVGVIFSLYPLSLFLTSLVIGVVSARFGRVFVYTMGLVLLGGGTVGFGFCRDLTSIMLMRVVQGVGGGCINVAGMALLLQVSTNIERDVGLDQAAIGLGYILGPPLGALLYAYMGFRDLNLVLGAIPILELFLFPFVAPYIPSLTTIDADDDNTNNEDQVLPPSLAAAASSSSNSNSSERTLPPLLPSEAPAQQEQQEQQSFYALTTLPILVVAATSVFAFTSLGLFDPLVLPHLERALGASVTTVGGTFMIPCVVFTAVSLLAEGFMKRLGYKHSIVLGLWLMILGFLCLGPAPFLLGVEWTRAGAWVGQVMGFVCFGVGFAFVVVAVVPLMHSYLHGVGKEKEDYISAVNSAASSLGEFLGPILGGVMYEWLPARREISCVVGGKVTSCESGASWTCFVFACLLVPVIGCFWWLAPVVARERKRGRREGGEGGGVEKERKEEEDESTTAACTPMHQHQLQRKQQQQQQQLQLENGEVPQPLSRDLEAPSSVVKSPVRPSTVQARRPAAVGGQHDY